MFGMMEAMLSFLRRQVGLRTDAASASGSVHGKLANLWNKIDSNLDKKVSQSGIKSVQRGVTTVTVYAAHNAEFTNVTIASVDLEKSFVNYSFVPTLNKNWEGLTILIRLTSPNNLSISVRHTSTSEGMWENSGSVAWEVIEFY